jgi:hypothetical protein
MLQEFSIRIQDTKTGKIDIMTVSAFDYDMALTMVSEFAASKPNIAVLGF